MKTNIFNRVYEIGTRYISPLMNHIRIRARYSIIISTPHIPMYLKLLLGIVPLAVAGGMIYVCIERLKEIDDGEEDDISKY